MQRITLNKYVPTAVKGVHVALDVAYVIDEETKEVLVDEVFCEGANITELLADASKHAISREVQSMLDRETAQARAALRSWGW